MSENIEQQNAPRPVVQKAKFAPPGNISGEASQTATHNIYEGSKNHPWVTPNPRLRRPGVIGDGE